MCYDNYYDNYYGDYYDDDVKIVDLDKYFSCGMSESTILINDIIGIAISKLYNLNDGNYEWLYYNVTPDLIESCIDNDMLRTTKQIIASFEYVTNSYYEPEKTITNFLDDASALVHKCQSAIYIAANKEEPFCIGELFMLPGNNTCTDYVNKYKIAIKYTAYKLSCILHYLQGNYAQLNPYSYRTYSKVISSAITMLDVKA